MERLTLEEAKAKYCSRIAVSSLAVLVEDNHQGKRRVIHDATHGTKVSNRIRCRDQVRVPLYLAWWVTSAKPTVAFSMLKRNEALSLAGFCQRTTTSMSIRWGSLDWHARVTGGPG